MPGESTNSFLKDVRDVANLPIDDGFIARLSFLHEVCRFRTQVVSHYSNFSVFSFKNFYLSKPNGQSVTVDSSHFQIPKCSFLAFFRNGSCWAPINVERIYKNVSVWFLDTFVLNCNCRYRLNNHQSELSSAEPTTRIARWRNLQTRSVISPKNQSIHRLNSKRSTKKQVEEIPLLQIHTDSRKRRKAQTQL